MDSTKILPLLVFVTLSEVGGRNLIQCEEDHQCKENQFCYQTGLCSSCTNCTSYYRMPHDWKYCSKSPNECGRCLPGYTADTLTDGSERGLCTLIRQPGDNRSIPGDPGQLSNWVYGFMVIGIPLAVLLVVLLICWKTGAWRINRAGEVRKTERPLSGPVNTRPPPYSSCGESPLLARNTGDAEYYCGRVWHTDNQVTGGNYQDKEPVKLCVVEKTIDGVQQAVPFEFRPEELQQVNPQSKTRSSCRPNDACRPNHGTDHHDDDDNEDGLSITLDNGVNEVDHCIKGSPNGTEHMEVDLNESEEAAVTSREDLTVESGCRKCSLNRKAGGSELVLDRRAPLCSGTLRSDHSTYSLNSETDARCRCRVPAQCSCKKNTVKAFFLPTRYDSGFISKCSVKFEELRNDSSTENAHTRRDQPPSAEGGPVNTVNINILNHVNVY